MREIKFRAWDKFNHKMYEVSHIGLKDSTLIVQEFIGKRVRTHRKPYPSACELMQLVDNINGTEVYEGDIVKLTIYYDEIERFRKRKFKDKTKNEEVAGVVKMEYGRWLIYNEEKKEAHYVCPIDVPFEVEVIGNIYEGVKK